MNESHIFKEPDYKRLYLGMFNQLSDGIEQLQRIQQNVEDEYIKQSGFIIVPEYLKMTK